MSSVTVRPIARPEIVANAPRGSAAVAKTTQTRKKVKISSITIPPPAETPLPTAGAPRLTASVCDCGSSQESKQRGDDRAGELEEPEGGGEARLHPARDEEAERHGWVEMPARDAPESGHHHADREAVCEPDRGEVGALRRDDRAGADEDQRERPDELRSTALEEIGLLHGRKP
jgi:hypothetical protein